MSIEDGKGSVASVPSSEGSRIQTAIAAEPNTSRQNVTNNRLLGRACGHTMPLGIDLLHKLDVGDEPDHSYVIAQGACMASASSSGEKSGAYTEFQELRKESFTNQGRFDTTMDNGDMAYYSYEGSGSTDIAKPVSNKWKIVGGTGKHKSMKGSGSCEGTRHADGTSDWACTGTSSM